MGLCQDFVTQTEHEQVLSSYYQQGKWTRVTQYCDSLISLKLAYHNIYILGAKAAAQLNKPYQSLAYLTQADLENPNDSLIQLLLYNQYLKAEQYSHAVRIYKLSNQILTLEELPMIHLLHAESGIKLSSDQNLYQSLYYNQVGFGNRIGRATAYHAITYLTQQTFFGTVNQWQWYSNYQYAFKHNWTISPAFHIINFYTTNKPIELSNTEIKETPWIVSCTVKKLVKKFALSLGGVASQINNENQLQIQPIIAWHPFNNNKFIVQGGLNILTEKERIQSHISTKLLLKQRLSLAVGYSYLNARNFTEQNGYIVNNTFDLTNNRFHLLLSLGLLKNWSTYLYFQHENKQEFNSSINYQFDMMMCGIQKIF